MEKNEKKQIELANKLVKPILSRMEDFERIGGLVERLEKPVCDAMVNYGCRNQIAAVKMVTALEPALERTIEKCFELLTESMEIATKLNAEEYEIIAKVVVEKSDLSTEEKSALVVRDISELKKVNTENINSVIKTICGGLSIAVLANGLSKGFEQLCDAKGKTMVIEAKADRDVKILEGISNIVKAINPFKK